MMLEGSGVVEVSGAEASWRRLRMDALEMMLLRTAQAASIVDA